MKKLLFIIASLVFSTTVFSQNIEGKVVKVMDGDTIEVLSTNPLKRTRIRLANIDAPESSQAFGNASKQYLASLVAGRYVQVKIQSHDKYGRAVGDIYHNGVYVNGEMIKEGLAWVYSKYNTNSQLTIWQREAQNKKIGLWRDKDPIPPWEFRRK